MSDPPRENGTRTPGNLKTTGLDDSMDYDDKNINGHNSINNSKGDGKKDEENGGRSSIPVLMETEENSTGTDHTDQVRILNERVNDKLLDSFGLFYLMSR